MIARIASNGRLSDEEFERMNRRNKRLNWDDYEWVKEHCKSCLEVGAQVGGGTDLKQDGIEFPGAQVFGSSANMVDIEDKTMELGRFISANEVERSALVCVLGGDIRDKFFPGTDPVGKTLKVRGLPCAWWGLKKTRIILWRFHRSTHLHSGYDSPPTLGRNGLQIHGKGPIEKFPDCD